MNENTAIVAGIAVVCALFGGITEACHLSSIRGDAVHAEELEHAHEQAIQKETNEQTMRTECLKLGRTWIPDMCLPKECPK